MSVAPTLASNSTAQLREATHVVDALSGTHRGCTALPVPVVALSRICHRPITGRSSGLRTLPFVCVGTCLIGMHLIHHWL
jgi:hypothetical protein